MDWRINNISHHTITASQLNSLISANFWSFRNVTHRSTTVQCNRNRNPLRGINCFNSPDTVCWRVASHFFYLRLKCKQPLFDQHIWWYEHQVGSSTITWVRDTNNNSKKKTKCSDSDTLIDPLFTCLLMVSIGISHMREIDYYFIPVCLHAFHMRLLWQRSYGSIDSVSMPFPRNAHLFYIEPTTVKVLRRRK